MMNQPDDFEGRQEISGTYQRTIPPYMAPMKRRRAIDEDGTDSDTEIIQVESASSSLQQVPSKKPRVSYDAVEDEEPEQDSDNDAFLEQATQFTSQQRSRLLEENIAADNGIIESVTCSNFMCHTHLEIKLGPLINFIIGHNGSGKSAVLTAIAICLGGKASSTNRGQSLKSFIKEGEESAMLSVKIKNTAESAYQQEQYGKSIVVERHFSRSGSSAFKLKSSSGRIISTRKADLEEICDYFALQIDNPMNVLTQDMARQFLNNSSPHEKYKFFMKGTQLEYLDADYVMVEQLVDSIDTNLFKKYKDIQIFEDQAQKAQALLALSEQQDNLRDKIQDIANQLAWVQVEEQEKLLAGFNSRHQRADDKIQALEMKATSLTEAFSQTEQASERADSGVEGAQTALDPLQEQKEASMAEHARVKAERLNLQTEERAIVSEINAAKQRIEKAQKDIDDEHRRLSDMDGGKHAERHRQIEEKRVEAREAKDRFKNQELELPVLKDNKRLAEDEYKRAQDYVKAKREELQQAEEKINYMIRDRGQQQNAYLPTMPRLLNAIQQDDGFQQKPVGPIGNYVQLMKPMWSSILETSFGGALNSFVVTSKVDQVRLSGLMQRAACVSPIFIGNNVQIDTRDHEPNPQFDTSLRVLGINDELARKQLIINQSIDQTILIKERELAIDSMSSARLSNVRQCFATNNKPGSGLRLAYGFGGHLSQNYIPPFGKTPRMKTDIEYQINSQREIVQNLKVELHDMELRQREMRARLVHCEQEIAKHSKANQGLRIDMQQAQNLVEELQDALDEDAIEEGRLDALKVQLGEAEEEKSTHEASYGEAVIAKDKIQETMRVSREQMANLDKEIEEAKAKLLKAEGKATKTKNDRSISLRDKNSAVEAISICEKERDDLAQGRDGQITVVHEFTNGALQVSARVPVEEGQSEDSLNHKWAKLDKDLKAAEKRTGGSRQQIAANAYKAVETCELAKAEVNSHETLASILKTTLLNRRERWRQFRHLITARARIQFFYLLSERGFRGKLIVNHKERKLDLSVEPDETQLKASGHDTHRLSGGEKSFSTICLLLSMWEAMGAPIRCLDEFDVFMDSVNREIAMQMMVKFARSSRGKQFVLITPGSMNAMSSEEDVKIIKMKDPERGQQTLNFGARS